jgi:hypothetical protein
MLASVSTQINDGDNSCQSHENVGDICVVLC